MVHDALVVTPCAKGRNIFGELMTLEELIKALEAGNYNANFNPRLNPNTYLDMSTAVGQELEKIAEMWGLVRNASESDEDLRVKIRSFALGGSGGYHNPDTMGIDFGFDFNPPVAEGSKPVTNTKKCECGSAKALGYTQPGPGHATWCDLWQREE